MSREHRPLNIGEAPTDPWRVDQPDSCCYIAFVAGEDLPDPGDAFDAILATFGVEPEDIEPIGLDDAAVAWSFLCSIKGRANRVLIWCERANPAHTPDDEARDARWCLVIETILEFGSPVVDAARLAATVARMGGQRTLLVFTPDLAMIFRANEIERLFLRQPVGALLDERHLFRIEVVGSAGATETTADRTHAPQTYWLRTHGLHRVGRPELEMFEIPHDELRPALDLLNMLGSRIATEPLPEPGTPFEVGPQLQITLVPVDEVIETLDPTAAGGARDRGPELRGQRAAVCAVGKRGSFRAVWMPPHDVLQMVLRGNAGYFVSEGIMRVRETMARRAWPAFTELFVARASYPEARFYAQIEIPAGRADASGISIAVDDLWIEVTAATNEEVRGVVVTHRSEGAPRDQGEEMHAPIAALANWKIISLRIPGREQLVDVTAEEAGILGVS
jgi:hypothetical protein